VLEAAPFSRVKATAIVGAGFVVWIVTYEAVGTYASKLPAHDFRSLLDEALPLVPSAVFVYALCYVLPFLPGLIVRERRALLVLTVATVLVNVAAFATYVLVPVGFPRPELGRSLSERALAFIYGWEFTPSANNMPSLHVAMSWLVWLGCRTHLPVMAARLLLLVVVGIFISTLLVKQHIAIDVLTGVLYAQLGLLVAERVVPRAERAPLERAGSVVTDAHKN
jgi:membrane-associated phospholipid phosphatase